MTPEDLIKNGKRKQIFETIMDHPGLYLMELKRKLDIPKTTLKYHLHNLEKNGLIIKKISNSKSRFFVTNKVSNREKMLLNLFRQTVPRRIIMQIYCSIACTEMDIVRDLDKDQSTISYHLKKLIYDEIVIKAPYDKGKITLNKNFIQRERVSNETFYRLKNAEEIQDFLVKYHNILDDKEMMRYMISISDHVDNYAKARHVMFSKDKSYERVFEVIYDVFPHPYYT